MKTENHSFEDSGLLRKQTVPMINEQKGTPNMSKAALIILLKWLLVEIDLRYLALIVLLAVELIILALILSCHICY